MYGGRIVETAPVNELYGNPNHPYTQGLLASLPRLDQKGQHLESIPGQPPSLYSEPTGCSFAPRCPHAFERCAQELPELREIGHEHAVACFFDTAKGAPHHD